MNLRKQLTALGRDADLGNVEAIEELDTVARQYHIDPDDYPTWQALAARLLKELTPPLVFRGHEADRGNEEAIRYLTQMARLHSIDPDDYPTWRSLGTYLHKSIEHQQQIEESLLVRASIQQVANEEAMKGGLWFLGAIVVSGVTYFSAAPGETYSIFYGALIYGAYRALRGLYYYFKPEALPTNSPPIEGQYYGASPELACSKCSGTGLASNNAICRACQGWG